MAGKRRVVGPATNDLADRMTQAGAYKPNAHPELGGPTPLDRTVAGVKKAFAFFQPQRKGVPGKSPTTVRNR